MDWMRMLCPHDKRCKDKGDGKLYVGVAVVDITPTDLKEGPSLVDANGDGLYNSEDGDTFDDTNGNLKMDAIWIAGFDASRPAMDVHDPIEGRILALRHNQTTVVWMFLVSINTKLGDLSLVRGRETLSRLVTSWEPSKRQWW